MTRNEVGEWWSSLSINEMKELEKKYMRGNDPSWLSKNYYEVIYQKVKENKSC